MADEAALMKQRASILAEIKRRGGEKNAPGFVQQLQNVDAQLRSLRGNAAGSGGIGGSGTIATTFKNQQDIFNAEKSVAGDEARTNLALNNPNVTTPMGGSTTTVNPDGTINVNQYLSPEQQKLYEGGTGITSMAQDLAKGRLSGGQFATDFNPTLTDRPVDVRGGPGEFNPNLTTRTATGDLVADRARIEDQVYKNLTRNLGRQYKEERDQIEQTLANRGIPLDPNSDLYKKTIRDLDERYDQIRENALTQATQIGGEEYGRSVGIGETMRANDYDIQSGTHGTNMNDWLNRFNAGETARANDYNLGAGIRGINFNEAAGLPGFGSGLMVPNLQPFQGVNYDVPNPTDIFTAFQNNKQAQQALDLQKKQLAASTAIARMAAGGGSGGGSSAQQAPNPFNSTPPTGF